MEIDIYGDGLYRKEFIIRKKGWKIKFRESYNYIKCSIMIKVEKYHMINEMKKNIRHKLCLYVY